MIARSTGPYFASHAASSPEGERRDGAAGPEETVGTVGPEGTDGKTFLDMVTA